MNITHLAMGIRQPTAEWKEIHKELLKLPFCHIRQRPVRIIIYLSKYHEQHRYNEGLCNSSLRYGIKHEPMYTPPIENKSSLIIF